MDIYEKKYKEALKRAKKLHKDAITLQLEQDIKDYEYIFPELKETEDERIRKELLSWLKNCDGQTLPIERYNACVAWLEKQGKKESDPRYENLEELLAADDIYQMSMNEEMVQEAKEKAVNALSGMCIGRLLLEKQGEP